MSKPLPEVIANILTSYGAIVSNADSETLEYIAPKELSEIFRVPEYGKIGFAQDSSNPEIIQGYYDSALFKSIKKFLLEKGKIGLSSAPAFTPNAKKLSQGLSAAIGFSNATFRMKTPEQGKIPYALIFFKYSALSDDKKEGLCAILINESNRSTTLLNENLTYNILNAVADVKTEDLPKNEMNEEIIQSAHCAATIAIKKNLKDFTKSLERRLNRDIKRVYAYYETLKTETKKLIKKAEKNPKEDAIKKLSDKLEAIDAEQRWKVKDLISKYILKIDIDLVSIIRIETQSTLFWIDIKRRNGIRSFALTYNSLLKRIDPLPCEACFYPQGYYYVCDTHLHIICADCFKICPHCGKKYCSVCFPKSCPKCKSLKQ